VSTERTGDADAAVATLADRVLRRRIRPVPDWPSPGVTFLDLTPLLADPVAFGTVVDLVCVHHGRDRVDEVVGIEARGFPYAAAIAYHLGAGFVPLRKPGKLPGEVHAAEYALEYGTATLELHTDAIGAGRRILVVDDVLATGGTAAAAVDLVRRSGGEVVGVSVVVEISALAGRTALAGTPVQALLTW
jgi:adenine phosphoribosyltransferase